MQTGLFPSSFLLLQKKNFLETQKYGSGGRKGASEFFRSTFIGKAHQQHLTKKRKENKIKIKCMDKWNGIWIWNARTSVLKLIRCQNADGKTFQEKREVVQIGLVIHELSACPEQVDSVALWGSTGVKTLTHHPFMLFINRMVPIWMLPILSCERNHKRYTCLLQIHHLTRPKINNKLA